MPEQAGAITREVLGMAGFVQMPITGGGMEEYWRIRDVVIGVDTFGSSKGMVGIIEDAHERIEGVPFHPPITTMPRLMDEIEAFEDSLKPKPEPVNEDIPLSAKQFIADGWEPTTLGGGYYKQGMHVVWQDDPGTVCLLVGNDESEHRSMKSLKAHIHALIDKKFQWLLTNGV
jgi:hypothetical protein